MSKGHRKVQLERREFLATSAVGSAFLLTQAQDTRAATKGPSGSLMEYGFWDYATPGAGGMEAFKQDDYVSLLDDMAQAGMNSLMIFVKWLTTGYRSRLPFQDQSPDNPVIASDNSLLRRVHRGSGQNERSRSGWVERSPILTSLSSGKNRIGPTTG